MISSEKNFIFIHVPKTAGSSITHVIAKYCETAVKFDKKGDAIRTDKHQSAFTYIEKHGREWWNSFFSFAVVRNPWDRVVSNYFYLKDTKNPSIEKFSNVHDWVMNDLKCWPASNYICKKRKVLVSKVLRYENLNQEFAETTKLLGLNVPPLERLNTSERGDYQKYYNTESRKKVAEIFVNDIKLFNYKFEN